MVSLVDHAMEHTMQERIWGQAPYWNPIASPVYLSLVCRATLSRHTGKPILEVYNPVYHYWATHRPLDAAQTSRYLGEGYVKNIE